MITQKEVAWRARTSLKTVSRVINGDPLVNAETRARVEAIIAELGYEPSQAARMMRSQKSNIIGFLADRVATSSTSVELIRGAQALAWEQGKQMMLLNIEAGGESAAKAESQLIAYRAEAVIYATDYHRQVDLAPSRLPRVLLNCFEDAGDDPAIVPDDYQLGYDMTAAIFKRGYSRPVFLNLEKEVVASHLRAKGFIEAAAAHGYDGAAAIHVAANHRPSPGQGRYRVNNLLPALLKGPDRPDVILCGQDPMAVPVYLTLAGLGLHVGTDIGVASFDDQHPIVDLLTPGLSTMSLPYYEMGRLAMRMAIENTRDKPSLTRLRGTFVSRASL